MILLRQTIYALFRKEVLPLYALPLLLGLGGCKGDESYEPAPYIGMEKITRLELSPSSPVLAPDGQSGLEFRVRAYYAIGDNEAALLPDRMDTSLITIHSSDGQTFSLHDIYSTTSTGSDVSFTAETKNGVTSEPISVRLISKDPVRITPQITVPIRFHLMYTAQEKAFVTPFTDKAFQNVVDRLNSVMNGTIQSDVPRPYQVDAGVTFVVDRINRREISEEEALDTNMIVANEMSEDKEKVLNIWISNGHEGYSSGTIQPWATFGNPEDIMFSGDEYLTNISDLETEMVPYLEYTDYGITLDFDDLNPEAGASLAEKIGTYFGLLSGSIDFRDLDDGEAIPDVDYMSDTYTYDSTYSGNLFRAKIEGRDQFVYYRSTNIMEGTMGLTISPEQAYRLRQAMTDIPYRQQGTKYAR